MSTDTDHTALPKPPRTWLTLLMGAVLLISGAVMGSGVTVLFIQKNMQQRSEGPPPHFNKQMIQKLSRDLELTVDQQKEIQAIFEANQERFRSVRRQVRAQVESELSGVHEQVEAVLTPKQAKKWNKKFQDMRNRSFPGFRDRHWEHDRSGVNRDRVQQRKRQQMKKDGGNLKRDRVPNPSDNSESDTDLESTVSPNKP
ncbi:MAG: hypothetical protein COA73_13080 [Candidatus Hydrogenedentota bacterium]|nr:MAG: hypothetical protein COA73_13080 [Candidatus Hydrogenedentota bacterium]